MDPELKALLDQAHSAGANEQQLQGIVDLYNKKKSQGGISIDAPNSGATFIKPAPSSAQVNGTSTLATGPTDLEQIAKGERPSNYQPGAATAIQTAEPTEATNKEDTQKLLTSHGYDSEEYADYQKSLKQAAIDDAEENKANGGSVGIRSVVGQFNTGLAKVTDMGAGVFHLWDTLMNYITPGSDEAKKAMNANDTASLFSWASDYLRATGEQNPIGNTITGKIVGGVAQTVPTIIGAAMTGGGTVEATAYNEIGDAAGGWLTKSNIVQNALTKAAGPLTQYLTATGAGAGLEEGYKAGNGKLLPTLLGGAKGAQEGLESGIGLEGQMAAGEQIGGTLFKLALKSGVVNEDGLITQQALKSLVGSPFAFGAASVAEDVANGRPIDWQNAGISAATALPFEVQHVIGATGDQVDLNKNKAELDNHINNIIQQADANAITNFATSDPTDVVAAMKRPETVQELQVLAMGKGVEAQQAKTYQDKNTLHLEQLELQKQADIKSIGETVIQHGVNPFTDAVNQTELPEDLKSTLISKAHGINQEFNPVIEEQAQTQEKVADLTDKIDHLQSIPGATDPVNNPAGVNELINMVEERTDAQVKLLGDVNKNPLQIPQPDEQAQKETESEKLPGTGIPADNSSDRIPDGGFQLKSKDFGQVTIIPRPDGEFDVHDGEGGVTRATKADIADPDYLNFDTDKIHAPENIQTLHATENPNEIARIYDEKVRELKEPSNSIEHAIANYGPTTIREQFGNQDDLNNLKGSPTIALNYFRKDGVNNLDIQADEINRLYFNGEPKVTEQDITDFMKKYPNGARSFFSPKGNADLAGIANRYRDLTGKDIDSKTARKLAAEFTNVESNEIREIDERNTSKENIEKVKRFIDEYMNKPGLRDSDFVMQDIEDQFERYINDPDNQFNIFHDVFKGDILTDEEIKDTKDEIDNKKTEQLAGDQPGDGLADETGSEEAIPKEGEGSATGEREPATIEEDDIAFQRGEGTSIPPERTEVIQGLMKKVFPNVETVFHPTIDSFAEAARANHIDATDLPNAFVDKKGVIHFNPEAIHADTQIHEYGHILTQWAKANAPALYKRMVVFGRDAADIKDELRSRGYKVPESQLNEEAFVTMLGRHGEGKLDEVIKNSGTRGTVAKFINDIWTRFQRYLIDKTGFDISKFKNIKDMPINEFLDTVNSKYLLSDTKVSDIGTKEYSQIDQQRPERPMREDGESMADYMKRVIDWTREQTTGQKTADFSTDVNAKEEKPGYSFDETSIKNKVTREERRQRDMEEIDYAGKRDFDTIWEQAKQMVDSSIGDPDHIDPRALAQNIIDHPRPLLAEQSAALAYDRMKLYNEHKQLMGIINDAMDSGDKYTEQQNRLSLAITEANIERNDQAAKAAGYEQGLGLAIRKIIAAKDYSLVHQLELAKIANGDKELSPAQRQKFEMLSRQLEEAQKKLEEYQTSERARASIVAMAKIKKETDAEKKLEKKQGRLKTQDQIDKSIEARKQKIYDILTKPTTKSNIGGPFGDAAVKLFEITPHLSGLAKDYMRKGINTFEGLVDQLHDDFKEHLEGVTKRDIADALSGYGKTTKPTKDTLEAQLTELKRQGRLMSALEDIRNGIEPKKGAHTENEPSDRVKELQQQLNDAMKEHGVDTEPKPLTEEEAAKKSLDIIKTRLQNEIDSLNEQLESGIKPDKKGTVILDEEAKQLKAERDRLKAAITETEDNKDLTDQQRVDMLLKTTAKSIEEYKQRIEDLRNTGKDTIGDERRQKAADLKDLIARTPELKALRDRLETLQDIHKNIVDDAKPKRTAEEQALDSFKKRYEKKLADLEDLLERGKTDPSVFADKPKKEKPSLQLDDRAQYLQAEVNRLQRHFDETRARIKAAARSKTVKFFSAFAALRRFGFLLNPLTGVKITVGALQRTVISPLEEVIGIGISKIPGINKVSAMAPREGASLSLQDYASAEARVLSKTFSKDTYDAAVRTFKEGKSEREELYDPDRDKFIHPEEGIIVLPGRAHGGLQAIAKENEYYRSMEKRLAFWLKKGYDITDPDVQNAALIGAFKDGNPSLFNGGKSISFSEIRAEAIRDSKRAAYQQDDKNIILEFFKGGQNRIEKYGETGEIVNEILKATYPFSKQPINYAFEAGSYTLGAFKSAFILRNAIVGGFKGEFGKEIEKLTPQQADAVMRNFKKQGVGAAFMLLGWFMHGAIAGFWNKDEKWTDKGPQPNDVKILGVEIPHILIDHPAFMAMNAGATARNVNDAMANKKGVAPLANGIMDAFGGIVEHIPYADNPIVDAISNQTGGKANRMAGAAGNMARDFILTPPMAQLAKWLDENKYGHTNKRATTGKTLWGTFKNNFESGIPVVRSEELKKK